MASVAEELESDLRTIEVSDIGPVERVSIPVPNEGGLVVLRARNGRGKTKTLEAVETALSGRGKLDVRDGALRGEVKAFGATITVAKSTRRTGELEVTSLEGKLGIADLVDPGIKADDAADSKRIKALVSLTGSTAVASEFWELLGGREEFEKVVGPNATDTDDFVVMADRIKREIEREARKAEGQAETLEGRARGMLQELPEVSDVVLDSGELQQSLVDAITRLKDLEFQDQKYTQWKQQESEVQSKLDELKSVAVEDQTQLLMHLGAIEDEIEQSNQEIARLEEKISAYKVMLKDAYQEAESIRDRIESSKKHSEEMASLNAFFAVSEEPVSTSEMAIAKQAVDESKQAIELAAVIRNTLARRDEAKTMVSQAGGERKKADKLRAAAGNTDIVLSKLVAKCCNLLRVEHGRLVLDTKRGKTYFGDLSHGERYKLAMDVAITVIGDDGVIVLPQTAYEGLDGVARRMIADHARQRGVVVLTAECSEDECIRPEVFGGVE